MTFTNAGGFNESVQEREIWSCGTAIYYWLRDLLSKQSARGLGRGSAMRSRKQKSLAGNWTGL